MIAVELVSLIRAAPETVFGLELDVDVHAASMAASGETATTSSGRPALALGDEVTCTAALRYRVAAHGPGHRVRPSVARAVVAPYLRRLLEQRAAYVGEPAERA